MALYNPIAELPVNIESYDLEGLLQHTASGWTRHTTVVRLSGSGCTGVGEDVTYDAEVQASFQAAGPTLQLAGSCSLDEFSHRLDTFQHFDTPPAEYKAHMFRRWAYESAALDLALQQAGRSLADVLGRESRPVRYVVSTGLGDPATLAPLERVWDLYPGTPVKLDAELGWTARFIEELHATGLVTTVDLKGHYHGSFTGPPPDPGMYRRVVEGLPDSVIEDPAWTDETRGVLEPHLDRVAYDAPICSVADIMQLPHAPKAMNIKPSRIGFLSELFRMYEYCEAQGIAMYGGGQFELGPGRRQIQCLASLFHPEGPNDVAPSGFNAEALTNDLPTTPLAVPAVAPGFH